MKKLSIGIPALICGAILLITAFAGCAGDRYRQSTGEALDSTAITARVRAALLADPEVSGFDVGVTTFRGVVQLSGFVDTPDQRIRAEDIAWGVQGVRSVENNITLKPLD
jgi:hyperosmotically inducible periplasmic protein